MSDLRGGCPLAAACVNRPSAAIRGRRITGRSSADCGTGLARCPADDVVEGGVGEFTAGTGPPGLPGCPAGPRDGFVSWCQRTVGRLVAGSRPGGSYFPGTGSVFPGTGSVVRARLRGQPASRG